MIFGPSTDGMRPYYGGGNSSCKPILAPRRRVHCTCLVFGGAGGACCKHDEASGMRTTAPGQVFCDGLMSMIYTSLTVRRVCKIGV